eukprot:TRINITY_DN19902_c0_g2_i1.p2 TRINITY_DN19902_c0_g2~~TRINITY_DN19902_c0_g2_i1.p2  ORF type:complete len:445 (+),score=89.27 TRINITY_DN19902_c0_g2_i1:3158-4492(+)
MEVWVGIVIGLSVTVVLLGLCWLIARFQRKEANASIMEASKIRLLEGVPEGQDGHAYKVYHNHFMGGWLTFLDGYPKFTAFNVFNVKLDHVDEVFKGKRQQWSKTYKAACQIYGPGAGPKVVRSAIHAEHNTLYRTMGVERTTKGLLYSGRELLALINNGLSKGEMIFFTYVVLPDGQWHFSHTGRSVLRDNLSKHAVHANAAEEVVYAGEFHVKNGVLIMDNSSGTFAPAKEDLPLIKELIKKNFLDLEVDAWDWQDERLLADMEKAPSRATGKKEENKSHAELEDVVIDGAATTEPVTSQRVVPDSTRQGGDVENGNGTHSSTSSSSLLGSPPNKAAEKDAIVSPALPQDKTASEKLTSSRRVPSTILESEAVPCDAEPIPQESKKSTRRVPAALDELQNPLRDLALPSHMSDSQSPLPTQTSQSCPVVTGKGTTRINIDDL